MGYRVSDLDIARQIEALPELQVDGKFSRDRYAALLAAQGRSEAQFEQEFRRDIQVAQLRNGIAISSFATPGELGRRIALEGETRDIDYFTIAAAQFAADVAVSPGEVQAYYDANKADFITPETVSVQYVALKAADVAATVEVTDEALHQYYDQVAPERYTDAERRRARHILIEAGSDDAAAKQKADEVMAKAKAGEDFGKLAGEYSNDPGSKARGGELGWATRQSFVQPFADALFAMQVGEISGPVKTQFGYHVIQLEEVQPARQRSFDEVRAELEADYRSEQAQSLFYERSQQLADDAFASLSELESVAQKHGLKLLTLDGFTRQGSGPFAGNRKVIDAVFSDEVLQQRQNSPAVNVTDDEVAVFRVTDYKPAASRPLEEVRTEIEATLRDQASRKAAEAAALADASRINSGTAFAVVADEANAVPNGATTVNRTTEDIPAALRKAVFTAGRPAPGKATGGTAVLSNGDVAVFVVNAVRAGTAPAGPDAAIELAQVMEKTAGMAARADFTSYVKQLDRTAKIKINDQVFAE